MSFPMDIPKDPVILLSFINTKLRDFYPSLEELCKSLNLEEKQLTEQLASIDYHYDSNTNQFL